MRLIYLLHGLGERRDGSVKLLAEALKSTVRGNYGVSRPQLPHGDPSRSAQESVDFLHCLSVAPGSLLVGIGLGGLVTARLQEEGRVDLHVIAISSPTWGCGVAVSRRAETRFALYSSRDDVIAGRTATWPWLAQAYDLAWLTHDTDQHITKLAKIVAAYLKDGEIERAIREDQCGESYPFYVPSP